MKPQTYPLSNNFFALYVLSGKVHVKMIDTKRIDSVGATAPNLYKILNLVVEENSFSKPNHVGFGCDGAAAMIGRKLYRRYCRSLWPTEIK